MSKEKTDLLQGKLDMLILKALCRTKNHCTLPMPNEVRFSAQCEAAIRTHLSRSTFAALAEFRG